MKWTINREDYWKLSEAVIIALHKAFHNLSQREPQLIANLVWYLSKQIHNISLSSGVSIKTGGVFVHAHPLVKCNSFPEPDPASVEIGDLLLLRTSLIDKTVVDRRAILLQAKKDTKLNPKPDNKNQHHLYAKWPQFEYVRSGPELTGRKRCITGLDLYNAAKYLLIGSDPLCFCEFPHYLCCDYMHPFLGDHDHLLLTAQPSQPELSHYRCFFQELLEFILGDAGKTFNSPPGRERSNDWDKVIEDLTSVTAQQDSKFMDRASSGESKKRGQCLAFSSGTFPELSMISKAGFSVDGKDEGDDSPPLVPEEWSGGEDDGGISIIEFIAESAE